MPKAVEADRHPMRRRTRGLTRSEGHGHTLEEIGVGQRDLKAHKRTWLPEMSRIWNELPPDVFAESDLQKFKCSVHKYLTIKNK